MISGGNATLYVADMDRAVRFYVETLGFKLRMRAGDADDDWAEVDAGEGLVIALHLASGHGPAPGTRGAISLGLTVNQPIEEVVQVLANRGVAFEGPVRADTAVKLAFFGDPDGNPLYLAEAKAH
ncbi:MAG TPA: VOC family protein [Polyangiaceae bacterium]|jgi:catechol 2,3-dioxygenase-like lactoylglutathione lyase family enzyme